MDQYYNIESLQRIPLGRQGENQALVVKINLQSWLSDYPNAQFYLTILRPTENTPYFASTTLDGNILSWVITSADVGIAGVGSAEIRAVEGNVTKKSKVFQVIIDQCLPGTASEVPPPDAPSWVDQILNSRAEDFEIDTPTGHLIVRKVDNTTKDLGKVVPDENDMQPVVDGAIDDLSLGMDSSTYELYLIYKGTVIGTRIDLPIESLLTNARYDPLTKEIVLTFQNGDVVRFSIADVISGLVPDSRTVNGHALSNDVNVSKSDVGLGSVENTGDSDTPVKNGTDKFTTGGAYKHLLTKLSYPYKDAATKSKDCIVVIDYSGNVSGRAYTQYPTHDNTTVPSETTIMSRNANGWSRVNTPTDLSSNDGTLIVNKSYLKELLQKREAVIRLTFNKQLAAKLELTVTANTVVDWGDSTVTIGYTQYLYQDRGVNVGTVSHTYTGGTVYEVLVYLSGTEVPSRFCYAQAGLVGAVLPEELTRFNQVKYNASDVLDYQTGTIWKANTFARCSNLKSIKLPDSLTYVGDYTFEYCTGLETAVLSRGYCKVTDYMFYHCTALKHATLPDGEMIPNISGNSPVTIGQAGFEGCTSLTHIEIPYGYTGIGNEAFKDCASLRAVSFWNSMAQAAKANTFSGCNALSDIFYFGSKSQFDTMLESDEGNEAYRVASKHYMLSKTISGAIINIKASSDEKYSFKAPVTGPVTWHMIEGESGQVVVMEGVPAGQYQTTDGQHTITIDSQGFVYIDGTQESGVNSVVWTVVYEYDALGSGIKVYLHNFTLFTDSTWTPVSLFSMRATPYTQAELAKMFNGHSMYLHALNNIKSSLTSVTERIFAQDNNNMQVMKGTLGSASGWASTSVNAISNYNIVEMAE